MGSGFLLAPGEREFWKERHWSIIDNDVRDAVFEISEHSTSSQVVRGGSHVALGLIAGVMGMDVYAMVGGKIVDHSLSALYPSSPGFVVGLVTTCLGSYCLAERCWPVRTKCYRFCAARHADSATWNDKKGKVLRVLWVVLLRKDPAICRPPPAIGHMWCPRVEARLGQEWEILLSPFLRMPSSHLKIWSRHSSSSKMS